MLRKTIAAVYIPTTEEPPNVVVLQETSKTRTRPCYFLSIDDTQQRETATTPGHRLHHDQKRLVLASS